MGKELSAKEKEIQERRRRMIEGVYKRDRVRDEGKGVGPGETDEYITYGGESRFESCAGSIVLLREAGRSLSLSHAALIAYRSLIYSVGGGVSEREGNAGGRETLAVCRSAGERQTDRKEQETQRKRGEKQVENRASWSGEEATSRKPFVRCRPDATFFSRASFPGHRRIT